MKLSSGIVSPPLKALLLYLIKACALQNKFTENWHVAKNLIVVINLLDLGIIFIFNVNRVFCDQKFENSAQGLRLTWLTSYTSLILFDLGCLCRTRYSYTCSE